MTKVSPVSGFFIVWVAALVLVVAPERTAVSMTAAVHGVSRSSFE